MKTFVNYLLFIVSAISANAQSENINIYGTDNSENSESKIENLRLSTSNSATVSCMQNTFYGLTSNNEVVSLTINGNAVTNNGVVINAYSNINSLATANDLINGSNQNVFYSSSIDSIYYHNGTTWQAVLADASGNHNAGGARNFVYYQCNSFPSQIKRFDGSTLNTIFIDSSITFSLADIGVADNGNVFYFTSTGGSNQIMHEISPTGTAINSYPLTLNTMNAYGCFIMNNTIYVGIGPGGFPANSLIPINVSGGVAVVDTAISMPANFNFKDLAGCSGEITGLFSSPINETGLILYPNPASEKINVEIADAASSNLKLMDVSGRIVLEQTIENGRTSIDINNLPAGIFIIQAIIRDKIIYKTIQKLNP